MIVHGIDAGSVYDQFCDPLHDPDTWFKQANAWVDAYNSRSPRGAETKRRMRAAREAKQPSGGLPPSTFRDAVAGAVVRQKAAQVAAPALRAVVRSGELPFVFQQAFLDFQTKQIKGRGN